MPFEYPKPPPKSAFRRWLERHEAYWKYRKWVDHRKKKRAQHDGR